MRLQISGVGSVMLPYDWSNQGSAHALPRIQQIFKRWDGGRLTLAEAAQSADTSSSKQQLNFSELIESYRKFVPNAGDKTWKKMYLPVLLKCRDKFKGTPPRDGESLCMSCLEQWEQGSRSRQISRQKLYGFLTWAVQRGHLKTIYLPPTSLPEVRKAKRVGYAISDAEILRLLEGMPDPRWQFAVQLCSVYGLRPEELRWLRIKKGAKGSELWTIYQKSMGGRKGDKTEPRRLLPLLVRNLDGSSIDWKLQARLEIGEELPPLQSDGDGAQALNNYLRRREVWSSLKTEALNTGEQLTTYSFRHRYAKASHAAGLPVANIAEAMGHTIEVHLGSYARFKPDATADLYAQVNA
ncbi:Phage integrase family protein [Prochlorococcus sp. MIT 1303]|nr:Phage integrase family protein [Prochlorococcus sp. MIT 1303]